MSRNSNSHVLVAQNNSCTERTFPAGPTHDIDLPDTATMRRSKGNSETIVSLKSDFDVKETGTIVSEDGIRENCTHVARRSDGTSGTAGMGTSCERGVHASRKEEKNISHELEEKVTKSEVNDNPNVRAGSSQKNKTELREVCKSLSILLSGQETKPQLTRKIKEVQTERVPPRQAILEFGRHRGKTYEWVRAHDKQYCEWAVLTVVEESATASPQLKKFASHVEQSRGAPPRVTSSPRRKLHSQTTKLNPEEELADLTKRVEHLQAMVRQRKTSAKSGAT